MKWLVPSGGNRRELDAVRARPHELAGAIGRRMADDGDQIPLAARPHPQDAEAAVLVAEGHALDEAGEVLLPVDANDAVLMT